MFARGDCLMRISPRYGVISLPYSLIGSNVASFIPSSICCGQMSLTSFQ